MFQIEINEKNSQSNLRTRPQRFSTSHRTKFTSTSSSTLFTFKKSTLVNFFLCCIIPFYPFFIIAIWIASKYIFFLFQAPPQDVNSIAIHKHGHHMAGLATLFWTLFVILIIIFHLFLCKLVYRELCGNSIMNAETTTGRGGYSSSYNKKYRYARTV